MQRAPVRLPPFAIAVVLAQPAHVAVLRHSLPALQLLLQAGYDVSVQSSAGWTVLEDAVAVGDVPIVRELLVASHEAQLRMWRQKKPVVLHAMESMPDFQMKLSWEFGSPVFSGLVKQFAPYDEYTIYKVGTKLRVDASIVGFEGVRWVRGRVSLRFDGGAPEGELCIVNHDERKVFAKEAGMFAGKQEADSLEAEADFLLGTEVVQVNVRTANTTFDPVKLRLRDGHKTEAVGGWSTTVYAASSDLEIERKTKTGKVRALPETFGEYLNPPETHDTAAARRGRRGGRRRASNDEEEVQVIKKRATVRALRRGDATARRERGDPPTGSCSLAARMRAGPSEHGEGLPDLDGAARAPARDGRAAQQGDREGALLPAGEGSGRPLPGQDEDPSGNVRPPADRLPTL